MTKEEIAELIDQMPQDMDVNDFIHELVNRALAVEREACAQVCDEMEEKAEEHGTECCKWPTPSDCAYAIRARGQA
jgi:hypothetical protein